MSALASIYSKIIQKINKMSNMCYQNYGEHRLERRLFTEYVLISFLSCEFIICQLKHKNLLILES